MKIFLSKGRGIWASGETQVPEPDQKNGQSRETDPVSGVKRRARHQLDHGVDQAQENHAKYDHNHCDPDCLACDISHASRLYLRQGELARNLCRCGPTAIALGHANYGTSSSIDEGFHSKS
jgi:hypothetical protein